MNRDIPITDRDKLGKMCLIYRLQGTPSRLAQVTERASFPYLRDFASEGTGLPSASTDYAMLFNILHAECPAVLLAEAFRVLAEGGLLGIIHWNYDPITPHSPSMDIRPRPEQCRDWAVKKGFRLLAPGIVSLPPYHYGMTLERP